MTTMTEPKSSVDRPNRYQAYVRWVEYICRTDPGARTILRKGLGRGLDDVRYVRGMHRILTRWLPQGADTPAAEQRAYYTVASLIAERPRHSFAHDEPEPEPSTEHADGRTPTAEPDDAPETGITGKLQGESLGAAFAAAVLAGGNSREIRQSTAETRLHLLTRQSLDGLHRHLPSAVRFLRDADAPVDYARLIADLTVWPALQGRISRRWLQDFYSPLAKSRNDAANAADADESQNPDTDQ
ncbi:type I-E CRISPR-associated protein Cse2/CasB [Actinacidiphila epipremni]|uniref:Type I-E CRISPR-associated protein Cse2/CasB n=1 Tax=Actinacidiphila epipremni TaxID=2053013 RepID=A0ABX0ZV24_9ACTN|nr:type I-E CRISPR-associated protein Cse2/CasB [Actinacidiphila epipremni]NJP46497.1 type I-E CRISPR-associated protein Cse2/CasB [Actinacidiphila epipremni]